MNVVRVWPFSTRTIPCTTTVAAWWTCCVTVTATGADKATDADAASSETLENFIFVSFIKGMVLFYDGLFRGTMIPRANRSITAICNTLRQAYIYIQRSKALPLNDVYVSKTLHIEKCVRYTKCTVNSTHVYSRYRKDDLWADLSFVS